MNGSYKISGDTDPKSSSVTETGYPLIGSSRLSLVVLTFVGFFLHYFIRINISLAIVCMVATRLSNNTESLMESNGTRADTSPRDQCGPLSSSQSNDTNEQHVGELDWDRQMMTNVLAAYFYGYVPVQMIGGWLASRYGGKHVFGLGILIASLFTLISPEAARTHPYFLLAVRVMIGASTGVTFPAAHAMYGRWIPKYERSKLISIGLTGSVTGAVFAFGVTGILCTIKLDNGWPFAFYIPGAFGIAWWIVYIFLVYNNPHEHPRISTREKNFILKNIGETESSGEKKLRMPWKGMLTSPAVYGIVIAHFAQGFGLYTATAVLPMYISDVLHFNVKENGFLSALPQICLAVATPIVGFIVDILRTRQILSTVAVRKICQTISMVTCSALFVGASFLDCTQRGLAIAMVTVAIASLSFGRNAYMVNNVDIAPRFAGLIYSFTNTISNFSGFIIPLAVGALTPNGTRVEWQRVFYIHSGIMIAGAIGFVILARGEVQKWAIVHDDDAETVKNENPLLQGKPC